MSEDFFIFPVGFVRKGKESVFLEIAEPFEGGLLGLEGFSHLILLCWFHKSDTKTKRSRLRVHPRRNKANPLTGVFATRSPIRPNPIAVYASRIRSIQGNRIEIDPINAFEGTPIIDIKPYIPAGDSFGDATVPAWVKVRQGREAKKPR